MNEEIHVTHAGVTLKSIVSYKVFILFFGHNQMVNYIVRESKITNDKTTNHIPKNWVCS